MREMWLASLAILSLAAASPALAQTPNLVAPPRPAPAAPPAPRAELLAVGPDDRVLGKRDAPITIIEYASLTCPHCAHFETEVLPKLTAKWIDTGKAKLVLRDYPLDEPATRAEMIARCAPPDRYYAFIDTLFQTQEKWVLAPDYRAALAREALLSGMGKTRFDSCFDDEAVHDKVVESRLVASTQLGVNSTPTFFINGTKFEGAPTEEALDAALSHLSGGS